MSKGISVIVPTWGRHLAALATVEHLRFQTHRPLEVVVVSDGPDPDLADSLEVFLGGYSDEFEVRYLELGWRPTEELHDSFAVGALMAGVLVAKYELQSWFCDDERAGSGHFSALAALQAERDYDFVYPLVYCWKPSDPDGGLIIGHEPPLLGHITSVLYHRRVLDKGMYRFHLPVPPGTTHAPHDWDIVKRWLDNGATYKMLPVVTLSHRVDH